MKIDGVKAFSFEDMQTATNSFVINTQIGQGGYGKVYKGTLADGAVVAVKRAQQGSLQGDKEFYTEIEMLSRCHHRNLVSLVGYCDEKEEQVCCISSLPRGSVTFLFILFSESSIFCRCWFMSSCLMAHYMISSLVNLRKTIN